MEIKTVVFHSTRPLSRKEESVLLKVSGQRNLYTMGQGPDHGAHHLGDCSPADLSRATKTRAENILLISKSGEVLLLASRAGIKTIALSEDPASLPEGVRDTMSALLRDLDALPALL